MKFPVWFVTAALAALLALQGWTLIEIVNLKVQVAVMQGYLKLDKTVAADKTPL